MSPRRGRSTCLVNPFGVRPKTLPTSSDTLRDQSLHDHRRRTKPEARSKGRRIPLGLSLPTWPGPPCQLASQRRGWRRTPEIGFGHTQSRDTFIWPRLQWRPREERAMCQRCLISDRRQDALHGGGATQDGTWAGRPAGWLAGWMVYLATAREESAHAACAPPR